MTTRLENIIATLPQHAERIQECTNGPAGSWSWPWPGDDSEVLERNASIAVYLAEPSEGTDRDVPAMFNFSATSEGHEFWDRLVQPDRYMEVDAERAAKWRADPEKVIADLTARLLSLQDNVVQLRLHLSDLSETAVLG